MHASLLPSLTAFSCISRILLLSAWLACDVRGSFLPHSWLAADCPGLLYLQDPQIVFHHSGTQKVKTSVAKSAGVSARWSETVDLQVSHRACL